MSAEPTAEPAGTNLAAVPAGDHLADNHPLRAKEAAMDAAQGVLPGKIQGAGFISRNGQLVID